MNTLLLSSLLCSLAASPVAARRVQARQEDPVPLAPGQTITLRFPELPPTLETMDGGGDAAVTVLLRLPDDYRADRDVPLFAFLEGGYGGPGTNLRRPLQISGGKGYVAANFPLFRKAPSDFGEATRFRVSFDDFDTLSNAYTVILDRIRKAVPNIDPRTSVIGGHSNGAHAIAVLLSGLDDNMLRSFRGFFMIDGGFDWSSYGRTKTLRDHHILMIAGDDEPNPPPWRQFDLSRLAHFRYVAEQYDLTGWEFIVAHGHGHAFTRDYYPMIKRWLARFAPD